MEGWNVVRSKVFDEIRFEGRTEGRLEGRLEGLSEGQIQSQRAMVMQLLQMRFSSEVPSTSAARIQTQTDSQTLKEWFEIAFRCKDFSDFEQQTQSRN
jgi:predicted transposase YdaD